MKVQQKTERFNLRLIKDFSPGKTAVFLALLLAFLPSAGATPITGCTEITAAGHYTLVNDVINSHASICINISSSDVVLDGAGHTIDGIDSVNTFGVYVFGGYAGVYNITVKNLKVTDWMYGIYYFYVDGGRIEGNTAKSNSESGIFLSNSNGNNVLNNTASSNKCGFLSYTSSNNVITGNLVKSNKNGFMLGYSSNNNVMSNNTAKSNDYGFRLEILSNYNIITNNTIISNAHGISLFLSGGSIWNNHFNNTENVHDVFIYKTTWNITKTPGTNIVGGSYLGGNYWAKPDGLGFSQTCTDADSDGICDESYKVSTFNMDYLPLKKPALPVPPSPTPIPEFPTVVLPAVAVLLALFTLFRRREH